MSKKYDVVAVTGTYQDRQGNEKRRFLNIGAVIETKKGGYALKLESVPVGWDGWASLFEPKPKESPMADEKIPDQDLPKRDFDDDLPF